ncbi:MAG: gamma-glutamyltransferase [Proteobacteria bacterium]|nr:gamma-glutamyltransferase [Pseudomonadota bacterium]
MKKPYAIAAGHIETVQAAQHILKTGGNAFDAILAAMMMSFVAEPLLSSPAGGGFLLAAPTKKDVTLVDFFSETPQTNPASLNKNQLDFFPIHGNFGERQQQFHIGHAAAAIPGVPAGIFSIHQQFGSLPLLLIAEPAIHAAKNGLQVNRQQAYVADILKPILASSTQAKNLFNNFKYNAVWKNQQLADFIYNMVTNDHNWFYRGPVATAICQENSKNGGILGSKDFEQYQAINRKPAISTFNNYSVYTNPYPSTGGTLILEQLDHINKTNHQTHDVLLAMKHADEIKKNHATEVSRGTTHMSVSDQHGNLASLTLSNGEGNGCIVPKMGFMMNNFLGEEDINMGGFFNWKQPQRMKSMMSPTIIKAPHSSYALGSGGSNRIKTSMFQVMHQIINRSKTLKQAIETPRIHYENDQLDIEPGFSQSDVDVLTKQCSNYTLWQNANLYFGGINGVQTGTQISASADFRRKGCAVISF